MARLEKLVSADKETQRRYTALSGNIATETAALQTLTAKLKDAQGAKIALVGYRRNARRLMAERSMRSSLNNRCWTNSTRRS